MRHCLGVTLIGFAIAASSKAGGGIEFEPNRGQWGGATDYAVRLRSGALLLTAAGLHLRDGSGFDFAGSRSDGHWETGEPNRNLTSYYLGQDPRGYIENLPHYSRLIRRGLYPGVDLHWYGNADSVEFDLVLAPHADPKQIRLRFRKSQPVSLKVSGELQWRKFLLKRPRILQTARNGAQRSIDGGWRVRGRDRVELRIGPYDHSLPLTVDPVLVSSTYWGGSGEDTIAYTSGTFTVGTTTSGDLPDAVSESRPGRHIFVTMPLNAGLGTFIYGGSGDEQVTSVSLSTSRSSGSLIPPILIGGYTTSRDLPVPGIRTFSWTPWQKYYAGGETDGFVLLLTSFNFGGGAEALRSYFTYAGTPGDDRVTAVDIDLAWRVAIAGTTSGRGLPQVGYTAPTEPPAFGGLDLFFMTASADSSNIPFPTANSFGLSSTRYWGGGGDDVPYAMVRTAGTGYAYYLAGETSSADFPVGGGATGQLNGPSDAFVLGCDARGFGAGLLFGGSGWDRVQAAAAATEGILVVGSTSSVDFPLLGPLQAAYGGGASDAFLVRVDSALTRLTGATWIGGSGDEASTAIATDTLNVFVGGWTSSTDFPVVNPLQPAYGGGSDDGFLVHLLNGDLVHATWFGGSGSDRITSIEPPRGPTAHIAGQTTSPDLPLARAQQSSLRGATNGFLAVIGNAVISTPARTFAPKDGRMRMGFDSGIGAATSFLVTSGNPAAVVLSTDGVPGGQLRLTGSGAVGFFADCLVDSGGADITVSADGYTPRVIRVDCVPQVVAVSARRLLSSASLPAFSIDMSLAGTDPAGSGTVSTFTLRPAASSIPVRISSSNPDLGPVTESCEIRPEIANCQFIFTPQTAGATELSFTAGAPVLPASIPFTVAASLHVLSQSSVATPAGFQTRLLISGSSSPPIPQAKFVSSDASIMVISGDANRAGESSASGTIFGGFYVQGLKPGEGTLVFSVTDQPDVVVPVTVTAPIAVLRPPFPFVRPLRLAPGDTMQLSGSVQPAEGVYLSYSANPGTPVKLSASSSDPEVLSVTATGELTPSTFSVIFEVTAHKAGRATITLQGPDGIAISPLACLSQLRGLAAYKSF